MEDEYKQAEEKVLASLAIVNELLPLLLASGLTHNEVTFTFLVAAQTERFAKPELCAFLEERSLPYVERIIGELLNEVPF